MFIPNYMTQVKVCGITNIKDGQDAAKLGADYLGFVFYNRSPRFITPSMANGISHNVRRPKKVGLFVNEDVSIVRTISEMAGLDVLQFHGNESPEYCNNFSHLEVWKAIRVKDEQSLSVIPNYSSVDAFVLDAHVEGKMGGTGKTFDWDLAKKAKEYSKNIFLAGGLNPNNVAEAIISVKPYGVDVSSGVEKHKGEKSHDKMKSFIETAKTHATYSI